MSTGATDGTRLVDSIVDVADAVRSGAWAEGLLGVMGGAAELGASVDNPLRELIAAGLGWLIEHVPQLREPFDRLAGDPDAIDAVALTWRRVAAEADAAAGGLGTVVRADTAGWSGPAVDAYRPVAFGLAATGSAAATAAGAAEDAVRMAGDVVLGVRAVVRDLLAQAAADLVVTFLRNAGFAVTAVGAVAVIGLLVARALDWAARAARWVERVGVAFARLRELLRPLAGALDRVRDGLAAASPHWRPLDGAARPELGVKEAYGVAVETAKESLSAPAAGGAA